jgi:hypothetical protein
MVSSGILRRVALVRTDVSEELSASFIMVTRIDELGTTLAVTSNRRTLRRNILLVTASVVPSSSILVTLMKEALSSFETSVLTRATRCNISDDAILHTHRRENLKSSLPISNSLLKVSHANLCQSLKNSSLFFSNFEIIYMFWIDIIVMRCLEKLMHQ